ncbi:matrix metalloproteinase-14 isoform X3 [Agrilus planipennis]|uniref:Matrix metalloproteinase-14 isoform X3 n=1 Tax=Agrilus planipennis TaxID=224129 RepID=A0A7F5QZ86_AGRPL|nr:matrix metalloproteinase-14 isoform X3 [Agrilus planipennis]
MSRFVISAVVLFIVRITECASLGSETSALFYLSQYGYLDPGVRNTGNSSNLIDGRVINKAIAEFQSFAGLDVTGELDEETVKTMSLPRCGVKDKVGTASDTRSKRYALQGSRWKVKNLTYKISKYPKKLVKKDVDAEIAKAFAVWSEFTDLKFKPSKGQVHIEISFETGEHGDGDPFDGPGGTLAHAYFPVFGGDAHFDNQEHWTISSYRGTNLFQVAAHEFGHSLGLSHSDVRSALMAPFYRGYDPAFSLDIDDIEGIQSLYGEKTDKTDNDDSDGGESVGKPTAMTPTEDKELCNDPRIDTIFNSADGETYAFKGDKYWKLTREAVAPGYPKLISEGWPGLPGDIDAAFTYKNGKTYFFKGKQYWRYNGKRVDGDYPKDISEGFTGIPDDIDAAMVWSGNGKIYFFKGSKFWRFDPSQRPPVKGTYPKPISNWEGLPNNLDAAFQWTNGYTYFYKDNAYYRFNDRQFAVDSANPAFPRSTAYWWFGCKSSPRGTIGTRFTSNGWLLADESDFNGIPQIDSSTGDDIFDTVMRRWFFNIRHGIPESNPKRNARY